MNGSPDPRLAPWMDLLLAQPLGQYKLEQCIGFGAFGLVFEATNLSTGGRFAVKVLMPGADADAVFDFENEALLLRQLNPCNGVINYVDGGTENIPMQALGGVTVDLPVRFHVLTCASGSVDELILDPVERAKLGWDERLRIWRSAVKSLRQMHLNGVAHRDLKSSNALMLVSGNTTRIRLGDLGRAKDLNQGPTRPLEHYLAGRGDLRFSPPEFLFLQGGAGSQDFIAADYYGLGSMLTELSSGQSMSSLVLGDIGAVLQQARADYAAGIRRDLSALSLRYQSVISDITVEMPKSVRTDATTLLKSLCSPVPSERLLAPTYSRDRLSRDGLDWVLRRTDIMIRRLEIEGREERRQARRVRIPA